MGKLPVKDPGIYVRTMSAQCPHYILLRFSAQAPASNIKSKLRMIKKNRLLFNDNLEANYVNNLTIRWGLLSFISFSMFKSKLRFP